MMGDTVLARKQKPSAFDVAAQGPAYRAIPLVIALALAAAGASVAPGAVAKYDSDKRSYSKSRSYTPPKPLCRPHYDRASLLREQRRTGCRVR